MSNRSSAPVAGMRSDCMRTTIPCKALQSTSAKNTATRLGPSRARHGRAGCGRNGHALEFDFLTRLARAGGRSRRAPQRSSWPDQGARLRQAQLRMRVSYAGRDCGRRRGLAPTPTTRRRRQKILYRLFLRACGEDCRLPRLDRNKRVVFEIFPGSRLQPAILFGLGATLEPAALKYRQKYRWNAATSARKGENCGQTL